MSCRRDSADVLSTTDITMMSWARDSRHGAGGLDLPTYVQIETGLSDVSFSGLRFVVYYNPYTNNTNPERRVRLPPVLSQIDDDSDQKTILKSISGDPNSISSSDKSFNEISRRSSAESTLLSHFLFNLMSHCRFCLLTRLSRKTAGDPLRTMHPVELERASLSQDIVARFSLRRASAEFSTLLYTINCGCFAYLTLPFRLAYRLEQSLARLVEVTFTELDLTFVHWTTSNIRPR
ncbi:hypothetical protein GGR57DRAFT_294580 [Xylariaceae sp. FL1272]|nr:hypothetical protein GGR57DRAFT_294580 [Xylariaceae sp. FL1272]